ncbi:TIGR03067 domain-containing protein [Tautonia sociabilis]|uniref:TIGR03067 domain-containing protein n=1 Tax=Tautonia sociabilis TaxID=2080755 RepID=A0A432MI61_9BACT|nr:TIGR03067 domain-containing protein [Tautonia sociabilis]RUL86871.1 TIGR03067 domain-containing protein [Tautonia sociabilis]
MIAALLAVLLIGAGEDEASLPDDLARHQGTWAVERSIRNGEDGPPEAIREIIRVVEGDRIVWKRSGKPFAATRFELDPKAEPKAIDLIPEGGPNRGNRVLGIYSFEDGRLILCTSDPGRPRPTAFEAGPGSARTLMTFRKLAPEGPDAPRGP